MYLLHVKSLYNPYKMFQIAAAIKAIMLMPRQKVKLPGLNESRMIQMHLGVEPKIGGF